MSTLAIPQPRTTTLAPAIGWIRALGRGIGASADGLTVGLVIGYTAFTAIGAPATFLGIPDVASVVVVGLAVTGVATAAAVAAIGVRRVVHGLSGIACVWRPVAERPVLSGLIGIPARVLSTLPVAWLAAFGAFLWIVLVGKDAFAPLVILTPPASTVPYLYLGGVVGAMLGLARAMTRQQGEARHPGRWTRRSSNFLVVVAVVLLVASASVAWWPGDATAVAPSDSSYDGQLVASTLADPGLPGAYRVRSISYGSGSDTHRPEFGTEADLITSGVDASLLLRPLAPGADSARAWFWGFDTRRLPIQGLAWLPIGNGPFPLVLIAHGNHAMGDFSEYGYAYLGEHLASRGFIVASIDENFLNGSWADDYRGSEQFVRAWLLLLHLDTWRTWTADGGPLAGTVDLERIALMGHSRGGEAASVAAGLAHAVGPPNGSATPWPKGLDVDAVVSIAPSDGQYTGSLRLEGIDFLTLQGGWDADARAWSGIRQYARTTPDADGFAAGMWVYRANHGQFNTVWGDADFGPFSPAVLNLAPLLTEGEQRDVAKTSIGAFLEASLMGQGGYRGLFRRPMVGREWLPDDVIIVRSKAGDDRSLASGGHPIDGLAIVHARAEARTLAVPLRALQPDQAIRGTLLTWDAGDAAASWTIRGLESLSRVGSGPSALRISLADGRAAGPEAESSLPVAIRVASGDASVSLPLARFGALPPPLPVRLAKHDLLPSTAGLDLSVRAASEVVLQTYEIPLSAFVDADPAFDPAGLRAITIEVSRSDRGALWIAEPSLAP